MQTVVRLESSWHIEKHKLHVIWPDFNVAMAFCAPRHGWQKFSPVLSWVDVYQYGHLCAGWAWDSDYFASIGVLAFPLSIDALVETDDATEKGDPGEEDHSAEGSDDELRNRQMGIRQSNERERNCRERRD